MKRPSLVFRHLSCGLTALLMTLASATAHGQDAAGPDTLTPFSATYSASMSKGISLSGAGRRSLRRQEDNTWLYRTRVDSFIADIDESLVFRWDNGRVIPLRYRYELSGLMIRDRTESIDFDWQAGTATGDHEGDPFTLSLKAGTLDPLGYQLQLRQDLKSGKREVTYPVIDKGDYDEDRFAVVDQPEGQPLKVEKVRDADSKRQTLLWLDPDQDYLLVRLRQVEPDGSEYELKLKEARLQD